MVVIDGTVMKERHVVIPEILKTQTPDKLHVNHMGIENKLLACKSVYWVNINHDIESHIKNCTTCLTFQQTQPKDKIIHHDILTKPWEVIGADMFTLNNKHNLCIIDYHSKFPIIKKTEEDLSGGSFQIKFKTYCKSLNIQQEFSSSYHHQSNGQVEACIKLVKHILMKSFDTKGDPNIALLQI